MRETAVIVAGVVILAAGRSRRMGRPKMLLPWGQTTVLAHLIKQWKELEATTLLQLAVICASDDKAIAEELDRLRFSAEQRIYNPDSDRGMFSSIQCAARWQQWQEVLTHWIFVLGDQPHLSEGTLHKLMEFAARHADKVCQPIYNGHRRHPVVMPRKIFQELANSTAGDLKQFLAPFPSAVCEMDDPGLELDMDVPEDYERAHAAWKRESLNR
jgi:molybdenum cofactor cytidylyltransferase